MNQNLNYLFVYCTFVPAENSLNAQPSMRKRCPQFFRTPQLTLEANEEKKKDQTA